MPRKFKIGPWPKCQVADCQSQAVAFEGGLCGKHHMRLRRYGDPHYVTSNEQFRQNCREAALKYKQAKPTTYKKRNNRHEHRVVAEEMLGRPLKRNEIVHHVDGDRHNNAPENLKVMTQSEHIKEHREELRFAQWGPKK